MYDAADPIFLHDDRPAASLPGEDVEPVVGPVEALTHIRPAEVGQRSIVVGPEPPGDRSRATPQSLVSRSHDIPVLGWPRV